MASSSTSSIHKSFKYDVFLSFRGEDTRTNFVDHLYYALQQKSIHTYKDDERIKKGKRISDELIRSIEESKFYIIVFSKNYASSSWCLDELVKIMECHKTTEHTAYPVFYDVEPSEVRKQSGAVKEAFAKHKKEEAAEKWREALKEAADLAGWELKNTADRHEAKFIQKVVVELSLELRSISFDIDEKLVGMESRTKEVISSLGTDSDVRMIGIKGIGGGGKTTLARAVFDQMSIQFEGKSFVENVREVSNASLFGLKSLQNQVLSDVLNDRNISVSSVSDGKHMMKKRMCGKKVIVVLDDVDHIDQLEALAGELSWFMPGSRIIITTRDEQVLIAHHVKFIHDVNLLSHKEAICLFGRYAFGRDIPIQGYKELSRKVVLYACGLPLAIKVLGSFLCGKDELEWIDALERLKTVPLTETLKKFELSYIGLEEDYKEIFLDVACNLKGWMKDNAIKALECRGFHAKNGLRVLEQKSLITIDGNSGHGWVRMHDHIEEMGRNIVRRLHPDKPKKHSRLWKINEIEDILANDLGTKSTRCIQFRTKEFNPHIFMNGLRKMKELRFLYVVLGDCFSKLEFNIVSPQFPNSLQYVHFRNYPFRSLPTTFQANNLVALEMAGSRIVQLWEGDKRKVLNKLRFLNLSGSSLRTFDLRHTPNLETLNLGGCTHLVELHMLVGCLKLIFVDIRRSRLRTLDLGLAPNLETLILLECYDLIELRMPCKCLNLRSIELTNSKLRALDIGLTPNLNNLDLKYSYCLEELHMAGECQKLAKLDISYSKLRNLDLGLTPNLETLDLKECRSLVELLTPIGCLRKLAHLKLSGCFRFRSFLLKVNDYTFSCVELLEVSPLSKLHLTEESVESCPLHPNNSLPKFQFSCLYEEDRSSLTGNLEMVISVIMRSCTNGERFSGSICGLKLLGKLKLEGNILEGPKDLGQLECLEELILSCNKIKYLPESIYMLKNLKSLKLESCLFLEKLPKDLGRLEWLEELALSSKLIKHLPDSICMLKHLKSLKLEGCWYLERVPEYLGRVECLEVLSLSYTQIKHLPDSICMLKHLKSLILISCWLLEKLPEDLGQLECLEKLDLSFTKIKHLPDSICMLKHLKSLKLGSCCFLEKLPEDIGSLECLKELTLSFTMTGHLPNSICMLKSLESLELDNCSMLEMLPEDLGRLERLKELTLRNCEFLQSIPNSICEMKCLRHINLRHCIRIEKLPEELGHVECLKELDIEGTNISHLPQSILLLNDLCIIGARGVFESSGFTSEIQTKECKMSCSIVMR